jgi:hypothetical protein
MSILFATGIGTLPSGISSVLSGLFGRFFAKIANRASVLASTKDVAATAEIDPTITGTLFGLSSSLVSEVVGV